MPLLLRMIGLLLLFWNAIRLPEAFSGKAPCFWLLEGPKKRSGKSLLLPLQSDWEDIPHSEGKSFSVQGG
jgi:hypothetical protein